MARSSLASELKPIGTLSKQLGQRCRNSEAPWGSAWESAWGCGLSGPGRTMAFDEHAFYKKSTELMGAPPKPEMPIAPREYRTFLCRLLEPSDARGRV